MPINHRGRQPYADVGIYVMYLLVGPSLLWPLYRVEDPHRFTKSRQVGAFLGLTPIAPKKENEMTTQEKLIKRLDRQLKALFS